MDQNLSLAIRRKPYADLRLCPHPLFQKRMDLLRRRHDRPDGRVMIQGIDNDRKVLAQICLCFFLPLKYFFYYLYFFHIIIGLFFDRNLCFFFGYNQHPVMLRAGIRRRDF